MMTRAERAKQFAPFDAMKGLQEALRDREERHSRTERHEISDEQIEKNCAVIVKLEKGSAVCVEHYSNFHDIESKGIISEISTAFKYLKLNDQKIFFDDIYSIRITGDDLHL